MGDLDPYQELLTLKTRNGNSADSTCYALNAM